MLNIVLFGPPGAGKGTQSKQIVDTYHLTHIAPGDLFRKHVLQHTALGKKVQNYINEGKLVSDQVVNDMVKEAIQSTQSTPGFLFDGIPRTIGQAQALDVLFTTMNQSIDAMIVLDVDVAMLKQRLYERGKLLDRVDDQDQSKITRRLDIYFQDTFPVINYYQQQGKLFTIDGTASISTVFENINSIILNI